MLSDPEVLVAVYIRLGCSLGEGEGNYLDIGSKERVYSTHSEGWFCSAPDLEMSKSLDVSCDYSSKDLGLVI